MEVIVTIGGLILILMVLWEAFETIVLPRRVTRKAHFTRFFYRCTWHPWTVFVNRLFPGKREETLLSFYGPLSLLFLLIFWATGLITGFAALHWACGSGSEVSAIPVGFWSDFYLSGTTFFTLGMGDVVPRTAAGRAITAIEAGIGFGFLALVIGYLPALNQSFSKREVAISLLDARAGSPPTAAEMLRRHSSDHALQALQQLLHDWERWSSELLESHLSYPVLAYFRSQHDNQSWLAALTAILDTCALVMVGLEGACGRQAELTFAMARHAVADLSIVFLTPPHEPRRDRLSAEDLEELRKMLAASGLKLRNDAEADEKLARLRHMYEPYVHALARHLKLTVPLWLPKGSYHDNWQANAWAGQGRSRHKTGGTAGQQGEHF